MPTFQVTDPTTGQTLRLTGDSPPTEAELEEIFTSVQTSTQQPIAEEPTGFPGASIIEPAAAIASGIIAEPAAGIAGLATTLIPGLEPGAGAAVTEGVRERLTFQPRTEAGQSGLEAVGEVVEPVGRAITTAEQALGDKTMELTGSPALAAAATAIPTAIGEALGIAGAKGAIKTGKAAKEGKIIRELDEAVPSVDQLKQTSRAVYNEIDELGVTLKPERYRELVQRLNVEAKKAGADPTITPKTTQALSRFNDRLGDGVTLTELDTLRKVANNAARSLEPAEAALGARMIDTIDQFLDQADPKSFTGPKGATEGLSTKYRVARDLWGRARRSELLGEAFEKARNQASGFENGVRVQFRSIINNKRQRRLFKPDEIAAMQRVVRGDKAENIAKLIGRLGFSEGGATNIIGGALGASAGAVAFGAPGAVIVPLVGQLSRGLAQRMTARNARFADQVIRSGKDARKIVKAYLDNTPKNLRDPAELSELLMRPDIALETLPNNSLALQAGRLATERRAQLIGAEIGGALTPGEEQ